MLLERWIEEDLIQVVDKIDDWRDVIRVSGKPLVDNNQIDNSYIEKILQEVSEQGPYVCIAPNIAIPHVLFPSAVKKNSTSFLKLNTPTCFKDGDKDIPVQLIIFLAAKGGDDHLQLVQEIGDVFCDEDFIAKLTKANTKKEVKECVCEKIGLLG